MKSKRKKKNPYATLLGGVTRFARTQKLPVRKVRETSERDLGYTLHKPSIRHFPTLSDLTQVESETSLRHYVICAVYKYTFIHSFIHLVLTNNGQQI